MVRKAKAVWRGTGRAGKGLGTVVCIAALSCRWFHSRMEDSMCYEIDYEIFAAQRKAQEARIKQEQRAGVIDQLLNEANKQGDDTKTEGTPVNEVIPAK